MNCALHILAADMRRRSVATLAGMSVCADCVHGVARLLDQQSANDIIRDARNGHLP